MFENTTDKEQEGEHQYKQHMDVTRSKQIISNNKNYSYIDFDLFKVLRPTWLIWQKYNIYIYIYVCINIYVYIYIYLPKLVLF